MLGDDSSRSVLSLFPSNHYPQTVSWCRRFFFSTSAVLAVVGVYSAACLRYGETVPFTGRTHLALLCHQELRECDEALFAKFKKKHAADILGPNHDDTIRVRRILEEIIRATQQGLALRQAKTALTSRHTHEELRWIDKLDWEVIVVRNDKIGTRCLSGAGKIVVQARSLHHDRKDAKIAVTLSHEVGHVIARHGSGLIGWLVNILLGMPILLLLLIPSVPLILHIIRRDELEADHIGILLLAAARVDPLIAIQDVHKEAEMELDTTAVDNNFLFPNRQN